MTPKPFHDVTVVGMHFRERDGVPAKEIVATFEPGTQVQLEREPENAFDSFAIKVLYEGHHIGYIEASSALYISPWIDEGHSFTATVERFELKRNNNHPICTIAPVEE